MRSGYSARRTAKRIAHLREVRQKRRRVRVNAERLHAIAIAVRDDLASTEEASLVQQLAEAVRRQVQDPGQPDHGVQASNLRQQLNDRLASAPSNTFSAAWPQTLEELSIDHLLREQLRQRVEEIFTRNEITLPAAADELEAVAAQVQTLNAKRRAAHRRVGRVRHRGGGARAG